VLSKEALKDVVSFDVTYNRWSHSDIIRVTLKNTGILRYIFQYTKLRLTYHRTQGRRGEDTLWFEMTDDCMKCIAQLQEHCENG